MKKEKRNEEKKERVGREGERLRIERRREESVGREIRKIRKGKKREVYKNKRKGIK